MSYRAFTLHHATSGRRQELTIIAEHPPLLPHDPPSVVYARSPRFKDGVHDSMRGFGRLQRSYKGLLTLSAIIRAT